jgi:hypothetical protein
MAKPVSLSVKQISAAAKASVARALEQHKAAFPNPDFRVGFIPPHCWFGFVVYNPLVDKLSLGDAQKLATDVHGGISASMSAVKGGIPGVISGGGHIICGFMPPPEVDVIEE